MSCNEPAEELMRCMNQFRLLNKKYHVHMELPPAEFFTMIGIYQITKKNKEINSFTEGVTTTQVVKELGTTLSAVSKLMKNLEEKQLIERISSSKDRRVAYIRLTVKGERLLLLERERRDKIMNKVIKRVGDEKIKVLIQTMHEMYEYLNQELEEYND